MRHILSRSINLLKGTRKAFPIGQSRLYSTNTQSPGSEFIVASRHPPISDVNGYTIPELVWSNLHLKENRVAFECSVTGEKLSYGQIYKQSRSFAAALMQAGLKHGDVVSVVMPNVVEYAAVLLGILDAGGVMSPANPAYTVDELVRQIIMSEAKFAVTVPELLPAIQEAQKNYNQLKTVIIVGNPQDGCHSFSEMVKVDPTGYNLLQGSKTNTKESLAILPFSSGTTGPPKGVELTHYNICSNMLQYLTPGGGDIKNINRGDEPDRLIGVLPFFHIYGLLATVVTHMYSGNHTLCIKKFGSDTFLNQLRHIKAHVFTLAPPLIGFLVNHPEVTAKDFEQVRTIQSGAAPLGEALISKLQEKAGKNIFVQNMYGLTETSPGVTILHPKFGNTKIGSCGILLPNTLAKIIDIETGAALGSNKTGELCIKGPQVMKGYHKNEEATRNIISSDGWLRTGDISYYDDDHCFFVVDRIKELIKVNGLQVPPAELENLLRNHPEITDVAVIGIPDEKCGEVPRAYIVKKSEKLSESEVHEFMKGKVAKFKELRGGVEFVNAIPKSPSGKILRRELKKNYLTKFGKL